MHNNILFIGHHFDNIAKSIHTNNNIHEIQAWHFLATSYVHDSIHALCDESPY